VDGLAAPAYNNRDVKAYSLWDPTASYRITQQLRPARRHPERRHCTALHQPVALLPGDLGPDLRRPRGRSYFVSLSYQLR
jgi:iron complex outermembrane receptor protein